MVCMHAQACCIFNRFCYIWPGLLMYWFCARGFNTILLHMAPCNPASLQPYNPTSLQPYNFTTLHPYNPVTLHLYVVENTSKSMLCVYFCFSIKIKFEKMSFCVNKTKVLQKKKNFILPSRSPPM